MISRKLIPYILLLGFYLVSYGHLSPGGGFQGGVVLATGVILLALTRGVSTVQQNFSIKRLTAVEIAGFMLFLIMGAAGLALGRSFLENFLPIGVVGRIPSAGFIFFLNLVIGLKVGAGMTLICLYLLEEE